MPVLFLWKSSRAWTCTSSHRPFKIGGKPPQSALSTDPPDYAGRLRTHHDEIFSPPMPRRAQPTQRLQAAAVGALYGLQDCAKEFRQVFTRRRDMVFGMIAGTDGLSLVTLGALSMRSSIARAYWAQMRPMEQSSMTRWPLPNSCLYKPASPPFQVASTKRIAISGCPKRRPMIS